MGASLHRIGIYVVGGGLALTWLEPPEGIIRHLLVIGLILAMAYLDSFLLQQNKAQPGDPKVVSLRAFRAKRQNRPGGGGSGRERCVLRPVYNSSFYSDVDALLRILRTEGLHPLMVTHSRGGAKSTPLYMIMLPDKDVGRAKPLIDMYLVQSAKTPS